MNGPSDQEFLDQPLEGGLKGTAVSMGNPHLVIPVADVAAVDLAFVGPRLERLALFPNRVNVHFVQVLSRQKLLQRTWERGAGITLACGTGACAVAAASWKLGLAEKINFEVTLLKAVEASRARAIDSLIRELASLADEGAEPEGEKKKD